MTTIAALIAICCAIIWLDVRTRSSITNLRKRIEDLEKHCHSETPEHLTTRKTRTMWDDEEMMR